MNALRAGLIGYGYVGRTFHAPLIEACDGMVLDAVASSDAARVHADRPGVRVVADYGALCRAADVDLVVIATPNESHHPLARAALEAGKHVVIDKPFTVTLAEADDLLALARRQQRLLSVFHNRRWDGDFLALKSQIEAGALGSVRELISRFDRYEPQPRDRWREREAPGAGLWYDLGPHLVDQALQLFGAPATVSAEIRALRDGAEAADFAQVVLGYPDRHVTLHCTRLSAHAGLRFEAHGTAGSFHCDGLDTQEDQLKAGRRPGDDGWGADPRPVFVTPGGPAPRRPQALSRPSGDYRRYYDGVRDAIRGSGPNPVPPEEARRVMAVLDTAIRSAREGRRLDFEGH